LYAHAACAYDFFKNAFVQDYAMLHFENAPKKATNLSLNVRVLEAARDLGMNISQTVEGLLIEEGFCRSNSQLT
jgi:hypothetical protein